MKYGEGVSEASVKGKGLVGVVNANARFGVLPDAFLKEVCFVLKVEHFHPFERVPSFVVDGCSQGRGGVGRRKI